MRYASYAGLLIAIVLMAATLNLCSANPASIQPTASSPATLAQLENFIRAKAKALETSNGTRLGFQSLTTTYKLAPASVSYSDYAVVRLLFEASRDAGFWNLHWEITNMPPNSDSVWRQWRELRRPTFLSPTATAECDELSALFAFLVERAGVRSVGLLWPYPNHTVAVWVLRPTMGPVVRVVVPTTQIFLDQTDFFGTKKFDPWRQKNIYEYTRRDVPDSFELPKPLFDFFLLQMDKYGGASDLTLQQLRYLREGVLRKNWTSEDAALYALKLRSGLGSGPAEDMAAFQSFAQDMRSGPFPAN
jgi:hypothetical protein